MKLKERYINSDIESMIKNMTWRHSFKFGKVITPGTDKLQEWKLSVLPKDFKGKSVLDIGCADGFFSFYAKKNGASKVLAIDDEPLEERPTRALAFSILDLDVEYRQLDLYDLQLNEYFDVIIFMGVIYHLKYPLFGLEKVVRKLTNDGILYLESEYSILYSLIGSSAAEFIKDDRLKKDSTNWWVPSIKCLKDMMEVAGLADVELKSKTKSRAFLTGVLK